MIVKPISLGTPNDATDWVTVPENHNRATVMVLVPDEEDMGSAVCRLRWTAETSLDPKHNDLAIESQEFDVTVELDDDNRGARNVDVAAVGGIRLEVITADGSASEGAMVVFRTAQVVGPAVDATDKNLWKTITSDSGSTTADSPTDTLTVAGGTNMSTSISGDTLTLNHSQDLWATVTSDSGSTSADDPADTLTVAGGSNISTSVSGDTLTVNMAASGTSYFDTASLTDLLDELYETPLPLLLPLGCHRPTSSAASQTKINNQPVLVFPDGSTTAAYWWFRVPPWYAGNGFYVDVTCSTPTFSAMDDVDFAVSFERNNTGKDATADSWASAVNDTGNVLTAADQLHRFTITATGSQVDSLAAGESGRVRLQRLGGADVLDDDLYVHEVAIRMRGVSA